MSARPAKKKCNLFGFLHRPKSYSYTWVLKKKRIRGHKRWRTAARSVAATPAATGAVYPSGQYASPQAYGSGQSYGSVADLRQRPGLLGTGAGLRQPARPTAAASGQAYGAGPGRRAPLSRPRPPGQPAPAPAPAPAGDEAPPAPEVPAAPDAPTPRPLRRPRPPTLPRAACSSRPRRVTEHPALRACSSPPPGLAARGGGDGRDNPHDGPRIAMRGPFFVRNPGMARD